MHKLGISKRNGLGSLKMYSTTADNSCKTSCHHSRKETLTSKYRRIPGMNISGEGVTQHTKKITVGWKRLREFDRIRFHQPGISIRTAILLYQTFVRLTFEYGLHLGADSGSMLRRLQSLENAALRNTLPQISQKSGERVRKLLGIPPVLLLRQNLLWRLLNLLQSTSRNGTVCKFSHTHWLSICDYVTCASASGDLFES